MQETCDTIYQLLKTRADRAPRAAAIVAPGRGPLTYALLLQRVEHLAHLLHEMGIGRNDRVAIVLPNGSEMAMAFLGVAACATSAPLNPAFRDAEFDFLFSDLRPKALIVQSDTNSPAIAIAQKHCIPIIEALPDARRETGTFSLKGKRRACAFQVGFADAEDVAVILYTSGTTSRPKLVPLTQANILTSARAIAATLELTPEDRCLNVMPLFHIHGLVGALFSSIMAGASVICSAGFDSERFFTLLEDFHPTWYTAVPTIHQAVLSRAPSYSETLRCSDLRFIRSSSAPLPVRVKQELEQVFQVPVIESYGMTEASHQIASNPLPPGERKPRSVGMSAGAEIAIMNEKGDFLPRGSVGEVVVRGAAITSGYANNAEATQESFAHGWFRTGDQGYLDADQYLFLTDRMHETINRGGEKISPAELDEVLKEHPAVSEAVTFAVPHPTLGQDIAAAVILRENASVGPAEIQKFAATQLADFKIPRQVLIVDTIPKTATGKIQRKGLAEKLGLGRAGKSLDNIQADFATPRTETEQTLAAIWSSVLGVNVAIGDNFFHLGGDSIHAAQVISRIRASLGVQLSLFSFFEAPTVAGMARAIDTTGKKSTGSEAVLVQSIHRDGALPLSFAQQRLWFLDQLEPRSSVYNVPGAVRIRGALDVLALELSLNEIVRRHEALRTIFSVIEGNPVQIISPSLNFCLQRIDLTDRNESEREVEAQHLASEEARRSFDLSSGPLLRATLIMLGQDDHNLVLTMHHIVSDGWSMGVLYRELSVLYEAFSKGQPSRLPELSIQYVDFAVWQRQWLQGELLESQLSYWKKQLEGSPAVLNLPVDRPRPPLQSFRGARQSLELSKGLTRDLKSLSRQNDVTLFMTLLAAFQALLYRYTGQEDIVVGSPIANRSRSEIENLIGFFANTLVLRSDLSGDPTFSELLVRVREVALGGYAHQDLPFEKLVEDLNPGRNLSHSPLFQVMFALQNAPATAREFGGLTFQSFGMGNVTAKFDLTLSMREEANALRGSLEYNTDLFEAATIDRLIGHFQNLLQEIVSNPDRRISDLPILTTVEKQQLLVGWNHTNTEYPNDKCIHELFEVQVEKSPDAVAVVFEDQQLTYRELNERANQVAHYLRKLGVGPEVLVGICMDRSPEMIIGLLGILKAGGAYVPLDPDYPQERLAFMMEDSRACLLLTQKSLVEDGRWRIEDGDSRSSIPSTLLRTGLDSRLKVVCLDNEWQTIARESRENPSSGVTAGKLAYVIYTSGSTGRPKGVAIEHHSTVAFLSWAQTVFSAEEMAGVLASTSICFDLSVFELFGPLTCRGQVILATDAIALSGLVAACRVTLINTVPSAITELLRAQAIPSSVCTICLAGEPLTIGLVNDLYEQTSATKVYDLYGPSEDTTYSTFALRTKAGPQTVGRPIANTEVFILDRQRQPVPIGVCSELYIGGVGLARGYLNRPELTAKKFIPHPFSDKPGARLYRTGDLARYLPDGNIEFLGRMDDQVKIRGYRIELGEIEAVLSQHPAVLEAVVVARDEVENPNSEIENPKSGKRLVVYVVHRSWADTSVNELRRFLKQKLPDYMIPSSFVVLEALPLMPNGKVDRRALPAPDQSRPELEQGYQAPRTPMEEMLAEIWREVLKLERIGIHDNFFDLGGHSLLATQVISRVGAGFQTEISLRTLFEQPTIAAMANAILAQQAATLDSGELAGILTDIRKMYRGDRN
jgi:amino acid adenylation domain-containing protein